MNSETKCRGKAALGHVKPKRFLEVLDQLSREHDESGQNLYLMMRHFGKALYPIQQIRAKAEMWCRDTDKKVWQWRRVICAPTWGHDVELDVCYQSLGTIESAIDPLASFEVICETPPDGKSAIDLRFAKSVWTEVIVSNTLRWPDL